MIVLKHKRSAHQHSINVGSLAISHRDIDMIPPVWASPCLGRRSMFHSLTDNTLAPHSLPDSFEIGAVWTQAWNGEKGASAWDRTSGGASDGSYKCSVEVDEVMPEIWSPSYSFQQGEAFDLVTDVKSLTGIDGSWFRARFGLNESGANGYAIYFKDEDPSLPRIRLERLGVQVDLGPETALPSTWQPLRVRWAANGQITVWLNDVQILQYTDGSPLTGRRIGYGCWNKLNRYSNPAIDNIRKVAQ